MFAVLYQDLSYSVLNVMIYTLMLKPVHMPKARTLMLLGGSAFLHLLFNPLIGNEHPFFIVVDLVLYFYWISYFGIGIKDSIVLVGASLLLKIPLMLVPYLLITLHQLALGLPEPSPWLVHYVFPVLLAINILVLSRFVAFHKITRRILNQKPLNKWIIVILYIALTLFLQIIHRKPILSSTSTLSVEMGLFLLFFFFEYLLLKSHYQEKRLQMNLLEQQKYAEGLESAAKAYRALYLENQKRLSAFQGSAPTPSAHHQVHHLVIEELSKLKNHVLSSFIFSQYLKAEAHHIKFHISVENAWDGTHFSDFENVEILGILINNAMEAARKTQAPEVWVRFSKQMNTHSSGDSFELCVRNTSEYVSPKQIQQSFHKKNLLKPRGIGLSKLRGLLAKRGELVADYDSDLGHFAVTLQYL